MLASAEPETQLYTVAEVARLRRKTIQCVHHWIRRGVRKNGVVVYLDAQPNGGTWLISEEALREFDRKCDPRTWKRAAERQDAERRQARRDQERLRKKLGD